MSETKWLRQRKAEAGQGKARQGKARQGKARQGKARQGKARQGKARQGKARQGKARQGIHTHTLTSPLIDSLLHNFCSTFFCGFSSVIRNSPCSQTPGYFFA
jgi:hypothetical protein